MQEKIPNFVCLASREEGLGASSSLSVFTLLTYWNLWLNCIKLKAQLSCFQKTKNALADKEHLPLFLLFQDHGGWPDFLFVYLCDYFTQCMDYNETTLQ